MASSKPEARNFPDDSESGDDESAAQRTLNAAMQTSAGETLVPIVTNFVRLLKSEDKRVYEYRVQFNPRLQSCKLRRYMIMEHAELFGDALIFDGGTILKTTVKLPEEQIQVSSTRSTDNETFEITITYMGELVSGHANLLRLYNNQIRRNLSQLNFKRIGHPFFDPQEILNVPEHKIDVWQGLMTAVNEHDGGTLMVCDNILKVVQEDTVRDVLIKLVDQGRNDFKRKAEHALAGVMVMTAYNNKTYRIDGIVFDKTPTYVLEASDGPISIVDFYKHKYNIEIRDKRQPLIVCLPNFRQIGDGFGRPIFLVPELCVLTGLTERLGKFFDINKQVTSMIRSDPNRRVNYLHKCVKLMRENEEARKEVESWGFNYEDNLVELFGRVLKEEKILVGGDDGNPNFSFTLKDGDFSDEFRGKEIRKAVSFTDWAIIATQRDESIIPDFCATLRDVCASMGITVNLPTVKVLRDTATNTFINICKQTPEQIKLVVIIAPNDEKARYDAIKRIFCCDIPKISQVIQSRTLSNKETLTSVCTRIGLQMTVKLGAEVWSVDIPPKGLMVAGISNSRDCKTRQSSDIASALSFVCSLNTSLTRWYSRATVCVSRDVEMFNNFSAGVKRFHELNGTWPEKIVIYRDSTTRCKHCNSYESECQKIKEAIKKIAPEENIKVAFVIVTKSVLAKFFSKQGKKNVSNPIPGTVIDHTVTRKDRNNFFLISESMRRGTVPPTMYKIVEDGINWGLHQHETLAYKLCHLYFNWTGTVGIPAPCLYARKLATLTGNSLRREPHIKLSEKLFYL